MNKIRVNFWKKDTARMHTATIRYAYDGCKTYTVFFDDEFYSSHGSYRKALDAVINIIKTA